MLYIKRKTYICIIPYKKERHLPLKESVREFPSSLVVRTWSFHCQRPVSVPGWRTKIPQAMQ